MSDCPHKDSCINPCSGNELLLSSLMPFSRHFPCASVVACAHDSECVHASVCTSVCVCMHVHPMPFSSCV